MTGTLLGLVCIPLLVGAGPLEPGVQWTCRGSLQPTAPEANREMRKAFDLTLWLTATDDGKSQVCWLVDEKGRGEFPWIQRCGRLTLDRAWQPVDGNAPALLYDRGEARSIVPLFVPLLSAEKPLAPGLEWQHDRLQYRVDKPERHAGKPVWRVEVSDAVGPKRTLWVDQQSPAVVAAQERIILGRGEEYRLDLDTVGVDRLEPEALARLSKAFDALAGLRARLDLPVKSQQIEWKPEQLALLSASLGKLEMLAVGTPLVRLLDQAARDLRVQAGRTDAVAELAAQHMGHDVEKFALRGLGDEALDSADLAGQVTVLHFWDYRDEPLLEPYGQVGYLDFLYRRRQPAGLKLYGVAVDGRLADEQTRPAAQRSVRKLKEFMNLSFPVLFDSGRVIKQFGDPRVVGSSLPLFVVIGRDGKIVHYHVSHYDLHQDQGLKELDDVVTAELNKK